MQSNVLAARFLFCVALSSYLGSFGAWARLRQQAAFAAEEEHDAIGQLLPDVAWDDEGLGEDAIVAISEPGLRSAPQEQQQQEQHAQQQRQRQQQQSQWATDWVGNAVFVEQHPHVARYAAQLWWPAVKASKYKILASPGAAVDWAANVQALGRAASSVDWNFLALFLTMLTTLDLIFMQALPDHARMHLALLLFWALVAAAFGAQVCGRLGSDAALQWTEGFFLELFYSVENNIVFLWVLTSLATPERLLTKVMFAGLLSSLAFRFVLYLGLAAELHKLMIVSYVVGLGVLGVGAKQLLAPDDDADVTANLLVRSARRVLGSALVDYYDEESEAVFVEDGGRWCVTLLGVAMYGVALADFFLSWTTVLVKQEMIPNFYLNVSSSALALFVTRALFFVGRDLLNRHTLSRFCVGSVLCFVGGELLFASVVHVSASTSCLVVLTLVVVTAIASHLWQPSKKTLL